MSAEEGAAVVTASTTTGEAVSTEVAAVTAGAMVVTAKLACAVGVAQAGVGARFSVISGIHVSAVCWRLVGASCWADGPRFWLGRQVWVLELPFPVPLLARSSGDGGGEGGAVV